MDEREIDHLQSIEWKEMKRGGRQINGEKKICRYRKITYGKDNKRQNLAVRMEKQDSENAKISSPSYLILHILFSYVFKLRRCFLSPSSL